MKAFRGIIKDGVVHLDAGVKLPEGAIVTVTIGEGEFWRAKVRNVFKPKVKKKREGLISV